MRVLVVNAGSSSLKLRLLDGDDELLAVQDLAVRRGVLDEDELRAALAAMGRPDVVGHRIVHGGRRYRDPVRIDDAVVAALRELTELAPLHQPKSLAALDAVARALPDVPAVACFDTAFHATLPAAAATYALPSAWQERWDLRRYGFHGLSHAYASRRATELTGAARVVTCHLGAGASLAAVRDGRSIDTTMGFTPLDGLVMATRPGTVDPGLLLWLLEHGEMSERDMAHALEHDAGLVGLAGTSDMSEILARVEGSEEAARLALDVYLHRLRAGIAAMATALGGLEAIAFTGGVGEHAAAVRAGALTGLEFLGVRIDGPQNTGANGDTEISGPGSAARVLVLTAREDLEIAGQVRQVMGSTSPSRTPEATIGDLSWIERPVGLRDGRMVRIRAVRADDEAAVLALLEGLSLESRRLRFFSAAANLVGAAQLASHSAWPEAVGLVALAAEDEAIVAHALAIRTNSGQEAEVAFEVAEAYHGDGLATLLLIRLAALAEAHGITHFVADVLPENHPMLAVFHDAFPGQQSHRSGIVDVRFPTADWPHARARFDPE